MHLFSTSQMFGIPPPAGSPGRLGPLSDPSQSLQKVVKGARPHVLVVDDENLIADSVTAILNRNGFDAVARYCGVAALAYLDERSPDIVVTDVILPDLDGIQVAISLRMACPSLRIVLFSGNVAADNMIELAAVDGNCFEMLAKPVHPADLLRALRAA